jgi:hypothetical protein
MDYFCQAHSAFIATRSARHAEKNMTTAQLALEGVTSTVWVATHAKTTVYTAN